MILIGAPDDIEIVEKVARRVPVVYVGRHLDEAEGIDSVSNDDHLGASLLVRHLVECGHKLIAHIDGGRGAGARRRREGFQVAMHAHGLELQLSRDRYTLDGGSNGAREALAKHPRPTAIFAANDLAAIGDAHTADRCPRSHFRQRLWVRATHRTPTSILSRVYCQCRYPLIPPLLLRRM